MKKTVFLILILLVFGCTNNREQNQGIAKKNNAIIEMGEYPGPKDTPRNFEKSYIEKLIAPHIEKAKQTLPEAKKKFSEGLP